MRSRRPIARDVRDDFLSSSSFGFAQRSAVKTSGSAHSTSIAKLFVQFFARAFSASVTRLTSFLTAVA